MYQQKIFFPKIPFTRYLTLRKTNIVTLLILVSAAFSWHMNTPVFAYTTNMSASVVIGQANFSAVGANSSSGSVSQAGFDTPYDVVVIGGKLIASDYNNHRVLVYNSVPTSSGTAADFVIGQQNMTDHSENQGGSLHANTLSHPWTVATDGTRLFIGDYGNHRVLIFNSVPTHNNASADVVLGQPDMTTSDYETTRSAITGPGDMQYDPETGKFLVVDYDSNRLLIFNSVPVTNNVEADIVVGQPDFTSYDNNQGGSPSAHTLLYPYSVIVSQGKMMVVDSGNNRVLIYNSIPSTNNPAADIVIGQQDMLSRNPNQGSNVARVKHPIFFRLTFLEIRRDSTMFLRVNP